MTTAEQRRAGIGASDAPVVLGLSPWRTAAELYLEKVGDADPQPETDAMRLGKTLEPHVLRQYAEITGYDVGPPEQPWMPHRTRQDLSWMRASLDGVATTSDTNRLVVEVKTTSTLEGWGEDWSADVPTYYAAQVQHQLEVADLEVADVPVLLVPSSMRSRMLDAEPDTLDALTRVLDLHVYRVRRDREYAAWLIRELTAFWLCVQSRTPPTPKNGRDAAVLFPRADPARSVAVDPELIRAYVLARRARKAAETAEERSKDRLKLAMGSAHAAVDHQGRTLVRWTNPRAFDLAAFTAVAENDSFLRECSRFDPALLRAQFPATYERYLAEGQGARRMEPTNIADEIVDRPVTGTAAKEIVQ